MNNWAMQCAKSVNGVIYLVDDDSNQEEEVFRVSDYKRN